MVEASRGRITDLALGREGVHLFRIKIDLERGEKFAGVLYVLLPFRRPGAARPGAFHLLALTGEPSLYFQWAANAFLGHAVHLFRAYLHFELQPVLW